MHTCTNINVCTETSVHSGNTNSETHEDGYEAVVIAEKRFSSLFSFLSAGVPTIGWLLGDRSDQQSMETVKQPP